jgi:MEMO1 family protein
MIVFAGIVPHTPLLIDTIGKENQKKLKKTLEALEHLKENLRLSRPETIVIISSHATRHESHFSINLHDEYQTDFRDFGDMSTSTEFYPDLELIAEIRKDGMQNDQPITLNSDVNLDYGAGIPLELLNSPNLTKKIVPISYSGLGAKQHMAFGRFLKEVFHASPTRIAVIASGDLSHCLTSDAPGGFHKQASEFDATIQRAVSELSSATLLNIDPSLIEDTKSCIYEQLLMLFGLIEKGSARPEIHSYEAPFGVGYLVAQFHL